MSLYLFLIGVVLVIALVIIVTYAVYYQRYSFDCYHQPSPQCFLDWQCNRPGCSIDDIKAGKECAKFRTCTDAEIMSETCPFPAQVTRFVANQANKCTSPTDKVAGPGGRNVCATSWTFLPMPVNTALPVIP